MLPAILILFSAVALAAPKPVFPPGVKPVGPYSPGLDTGEFIYVSGQGARDAAGKLAATPDAQIRQTLDNVKAVVQAAGLTMEHVVYAQCYLADIKQYELFNKVYASYFPKNPPARSTVGGDADANRHAFRGRRRGCAGCEAEAGTAVPGPEYAGTGHTLR